MGFREESITMAKKRCISNDFFHGDIFLALQDKAKVLYTIFITYADDDGFITNPRTAMSMCGGTDNDLQELINSGLILLIDSVYVIVHWHLHNTIQPTKRIPTLFQTEFSKLQVNQLKQYELIKGGKKADFFQPNISKDNISKYNSSEVNSNKPPPTKEEITEYINVNNLNVDSEKFYSYYDKINWQKNGISIDWKSTLKYWNKTEKTSVNTNRGKASYDIEEFTRQALETPLIYKKKNTS